MKNQNSLLSVLCLALTACSPEPSAIAVKTEVINESAMVAIDTEESVFEHREWQPPGGPATRLASSSRTPCSNNNPERSAFFGDLHIHTSYSLDAFNRGGFQTPDDAYRFAKGEAIGLAPLDSAGQSSRIGRIDRPAVCYDGSLPDTIQERAWTSPIWHYPASPDSDS